MTIAVALHPMKLCSRMMVLLAALITLAPTIGHAEPRLVKSQALIEALVKDITELVEASPGPEQVRAETERMIDQYFDYDIIARFAAGNAWRSASDTEKAAYKKAFREILLTLAETQFQHFKSLEYKPGKATAKGDKLAIVQGQIHDKSGELPDTVVSWRVRTYASSPPRIIDIEIENISMLITQQQENTAIINSNGGSFQALIDTFILRADQLRKSGSAQ